MVIDHAGCRHEGIADDGICKFETTFFKNHRPAKPFLCAF